MSRSHILLALAACEPAHAQCPDFNPERNPYVGDLHVHTSYSFDAVLFGVTAGPRDAYEFAKGAPVPLPPFDLGRMAQLRRPLDFAAVTDHAEFFGETQVCIVPGNPGYDSQLCMDYRDLVAENHDSSTINSGAGVGVFINFALPLIDPTPERNENICGPGGGDWSAERILALPTGVGGIETNAGGLAIVWAEENTRDAIFDAIRRREVYATSGTRPIIRSFGGNLPDDLCDSSDFAGEGYRGGVPMGGEIGAVRGRKSPSFAVHATQDPGSAGTPGTPLERIQIVKGWVDDTGQSQERVFDVTVASGAGIDPTTCMPTGTGGAAELCAVWTDPDFDRSERAFYYARVLENPTCRWSRQLCNQLGVDCSDPGSVTAEFALCCSEDYPDTIQERAWTSPIWYRPEALGTVRGVVRFGPSAGKDVLVLKAQAERLPPDVDPATQDLTLELADDDVIYTVTLPAGSLTRKGSKFLYRDSTGANASLRRLTIKLDRGRFRLRARTIRTDLSNADRSDHEVEVRLTIGDHALTHRRVWHVAGSNLQVR